MKCSECENCVLEGGEGFCDPQDFIMEIESKAEFKSSVDLKEVPKNEK